MYIKTCYPRWTLFLVFGPPSARSSHRHGLRFQEDPHRFHHASEPPRFHHLRSAEARLQEHLRGGGGGDDRFQRGSEERFQRGSEDRFQRVSEERFGPGQQPPHRLRSTSPRPSHLYGHPLFRSSHGDLAAVRSSHRNLHRFSSARDLTSSRGHVDRHLTRSDPTRSSRRRLTEGGRSREILATISPRRLQPSCHRCLPQGVWDNVAFHY